MGDVVSLLDALAAMVARQTQQWHELHPYKLSETLAEAPPTAGAVDLPREDNGPEGNA